VSRRESSLLENRRLDELVACHDCDLLLERPRLEPGERATCSRCGAILGRGRSDSITHSLALMLAALLTFAIANVYPFMSFSLDGRVEENTLWAGSWDLFRAGYYPLAIVIFGASVAVPLFKILGTLYVLVPIKLGRVPEHLGRSYRRLATLWPWGMLEVYMLGVLVAIVKLSGMATIGVGVAFWAFVATLVLTTAGSAALEPDDVWKQLEPRS
jgi:paraquat-inducible protein A